MSDAKEQLQRYIDALKLDILDLFNKPVLNVFEFRRIAELCEIIIPLCNSAAGGTIMPNVITDALWACEEKAPTLHAALGGHIFDADTLLKEKYEAMARDHADLRQKIATARLAERDFTRNTHILSAQIENLALEEAGVASERRRLAALSEDLQRRELALTSGGDAAKQLSKGDEVVDATLEEPEQAAEQGEAP